jgi:hypothetical protein
MGWTFSFQSCSSCLLFLSCTNNSFFRKENKLALCEAQLVVFQGSGCTPNW